MKRVLVINEPYECPLRGINDKGFAYCTISGSLCHNEFPADCCLKYAPIIENKPCPFKTSKCVDLSECTYQKSTLIFHCDVLKKNGKCPLIQDNTVLIDHTPHYEFKDSMLFHFQQAEDGMWEMYNIDCDLHIFGLTKEDCLEELEENIEDFCHAFFIHKKEDMSEHSLKLFEKLEKYINMNDVRERLHD